MNYDDFFAEAKRLNVVLADDADADRQPFSLSNEALFQTPLLAMVILVIAKGRRKPELSEIGQLVGDCIERSIEGFKGSSQDIGWSANLRIRTVKALTFLEVAGLITLSRTKSITATDCGRRAIDRVYEHDGRLAQALLLVERAHENITAENQIRSRLL